MPGMVMLMYVLIAACGNLKALAFYKQHFPELRRIGEAGTGRDRALSWKGDATLESTLESTELQSVPSGAIASLSGAFVMVKCVGRVLENTCRPSLLLFPTTLAV